MTIALFWVGAALVVVAIIGSALEFIRDAGPAGGLTERAVRAGMAPRTGNVSPSSPVRLPYKSSPQVPPVADAPSRAPTPPGHARATTSLAFGSDRNPCNDPECPWCND